MSTTNGRQGEQKGLAAGDVWQQQVVDPMRRGKRNTLRDAINGMWTTENYAVK